MYKSEHPLSIMSFPEQIAEALKTAYNGWTYLSSKKNTNETRSFRKR